MAATVGQHPERTAFQIPMRRYYSMEGVEALVHGSSAHTASSPLEGDHQHLDLPTTLSGNNALVTMMLATAHLAG